MDRALAAAVAIVEGEVRELLRRRGVDPQTEGQAVERLIEEVAADYLDRSLVSALPPLGELAAVCRQVRDAVCGFGALQPLLDDPDVEEIWIKVRLSDG